MLGRFTVFRYRPVNEKRDAWYIINVIPFFFFFFFFFYYGHILFFIIFSDNLRNVLEIIFLTTGCFIYLVSNITIVLHWLFWLAFLFSVNNFAQIRIIRGDLKNMQCKNYYRLQKVIWKQTYINSSINIIFSLSCLYGTERKLKEKKKTGYIRKKISLSRFKLGTISVSKIIWKYDDNFYYSNHECWRCSLYYIIFNIKESIQRAYIRLLFFNND